jgi:hypothetical protein
MSNVISFLESVGKDAALRHAGKDEMKLALAQTEIEPQLQAAIASGDQARMEALLGAKTNVVCAIMPGKEEDDEGEEGPSKDDDEITGQGTLRVVVAAG